MAANKTIGNIPLVKKMNLSISRSICVCRDGPGHIEKWLREPD